jgi:uncharacterized protein (DUF1778 family)
MQTAAHTERINIRLEPSKKDLIERAAALRGLTLTQFVILTLCEEAKQVLSNDEILVLSDRDRDAFLKALDNPPAVNQRLRKAAEDYKARRSNGQLRSL